MLEMYRTDGIEGLKTERQKESAIPTVKTRMGRWWNKSLDWQIDWQMFPSTFFQIYKKKSANSLFPLKSIVRIFFLAVSMV